MLATIASIYIHLHMFLRRRRGRVDNIQRTVSKELQQTQPFELCDPELGKSIDEDTVSWGPAVCQLPQGPGGSAGYMESWNESVADFINRKARALILLFPLSVSPHS